MTEEKRPVLSLKRKPAADTAATGTPETPVVVRRKKVVVVTTPPAWKVKKEKLERAKKADEAAARESAPVVNAVKPPPPVRYLRLLPPEQAIMTLKAFWPQLFDGNVPRLLATGMRDHLFADITQRNLPLSHKQVLKCLKSLTRSEEYLSLMQAGAPRYDLQGNIVATVTPEEENYARERRVRQSRLSARIQSQTL
ncbi:TPA: fertility inhibition protein FinO [Klebsiella pneumoniae]|jgi:hypothetical protein|uniref:Fertility inhibition protein n=1 Tax=Raoultella planticola TaxID=575 RepID=A0A485D3K4_RAOPL|nr:MULTISPECIES: fertility inhibition protein FinO [Klebsiella/Raoultella group]KFD01851.1 FinO family plasmid conjugative transfer fertility inhibition protein [Raoultella planticola ATCC 33531]QBI37332.1 conjugal transfer protein [Klebsiella pneumoniae]VFS91423.1 Conjugal transfer repressor [Raoultella planticola]VTM94365.1 Conjugal transfer repressor [Raoultella planticola]HBS5970855.1 fertility inhibition protein FinO [Klebsiella pneumoniae]